jgi:hypothetical protein
VVDIYWLMTKGNVHVKLNLKVAIAGVVTAAFAGGGLLALAAPAYAGTAPPWEPDPNTASYGNIALYDANGVQVSSGTNLNSAFAYAVGTTAADTGATKAIVNFYNPQHGVPTTSWTGTADGGITTFSPATSLPAGTPPTVTGQAPTFPVATGAPADINTWLSSNTPDTTTGYANTIEVRLTDSGTGGHGSAAGTYWETDIGYNTTASAITVDGTTVPANGWAQLFPQPTILSPAETLSTSASGGTLTTGSPITLTATGPTTPAGDVLFSDNGAPISGGTSPYVAASGGTATFTYTPAAGSHSYTATFVPVPFVETGTNTTNAALDASSASSAAAVTVSAALVGTTTTLSAGSNSIAFGASDTLTATVTEGDSAALGVAGNVQFEIGGVAFGGPVATTVAGTTGTAVLTTTTLPAGTDNVTAVFTPTDSAAYSGSTSAVVAIVVSAPAACSLSGSSCSDTQNIQVSVNPGTITITTPYTAANPFVLPALTLSSDGTYLQSSAPFPALALPFAQQIVVTSSLAPAQAWTLSVAATALTGSGGSIPASGLGLTTGALLDTGVGGYPGTVTFSNIPALNPSPADSAGTGPGLSATPQTWATSTAADGFAALEGELTLDAPVSTPAGTYSGTITFSVT